MAFFKSRSNTSASQEDRNPDSDDNQSMDVLRQRARHRLMGATLLVLLGVIGFPLVFDTKPREVSADIQIDMPDRESVRPAQAPAAPVADKPPVPDSVKLPEPQALETLPKEETVNITAAEPSKPKDEVAPRFIVQVGAYSDESKVKEVRAKLERAGFKTYVHVAQLKEGKRTRVRIGPFDSKDEAQQTVKKIKALNFTAAVLTL